MARTRTLLHLQTMIGMAAEKWRTLEQTVSHSNMAAENWGNPDGPDTHAVAPSTMLSMAAENWRRLEQTPTAT
jgi:hypothetical protein